MSILLKPEEAALRAEIAERMENVRKAFDEGRTGVDVQKTINEAGERSHALHMLLKSRGFEPKHHAYMIKNRESQPDDSEFYMHFHPIEDLLKFLNNEHANDDPIDETMGSEFSFRVFSKRWGHDDKYTVKRTEDGWEISHLGIGGPCDKGGRPFLFENLRHDSIQYPEGLGGWMEWIWNQAATKGLTVEQVQTGIQELADWVTQTEQTTPSGGVWEGY
ncbi:MAG: hypothetical protein AAB263_06005 [Planctomycetota bacterium]